MLPEEKDEWLPRIEECVTAGDDNSDRASKVLQLRHGEVVWQAGALRKRILLRALSDGVMERCCSTGSDPEPLGPELVAEGQKPKGIVGV